MKTARQANRIVAAPRPVADPPSADPRGGNTDDSMDVSAPARLAAFSTKAPRTSRFRLPLPQRRNGKVRVAEGRRIATIVWFSRQLFVLTGSGMPLVQAIGALERQAKEDDWRLILSQIRTRVEEGGSLSEALAAHRQYFDAVFVSLVSAGETSGQLGTMLNRLTKLAQQQLATRRAVIGALVYPLLLMGVAGAALAAMIIFVLPRFQGLFETLDMPMPPTTKALMAIAGAIRVYWWVVLLSIIVGSVSSMYFFRTDRGKRTFDTAAISVPKIGPIVRSFATARIARLLGVLVQSHVPLMDSIRLVRASATNCHYAALMDRVETIVGQGESVSAGLNNPKLIPPSVYEAVRSGEASGQVGALLGDIADFLDEENQSSIRGLTGILEPVILIVLGLMVGVVAISLFLPLFDLTAMTQTGAGR